MAIKDLTGKRFGDMVVIKRVEDYILPGGQSQVQWLCKCDCGKEFIAKASNISKGRTTSCGCTYKNNFQDLTGQTFGRLTVIERAPDKILPSGQHKTAYLCECSCPEHNRVIVSAIHLKDGHARSCGCLNKELSSKRLKERSEGIGVTHGKYNTGIYKSYEGMVDRCYNPDSRFYHRYGGRGITICEEWYNPDRGHRFDVDKFRNFYNWAMTHGYKEGLSIDRIDNNGNYCPENCRWATPKEQSNNKSINHYVEYNNDTFTISQLADVFGIDTNTFYSILQSNNFDPNAVMRPVQTPYGFTVNAPFNYNAQLPMNCIYFIDQYGFPVSESQYIPPQPQPVLWECDSRGFITKPIID